MATSVLRVCVLVLQLSKFLLMLLKRGLCVSCCCVYVLHYSIVVFVKADCSQIYIPAKSNYFYFVFLFMVKAVSFICRYQRHVDTNLN